ncbi:hypothetical protein IAT40_001786 [Kwoniella sp. CBS 6097]
MLQLDDQSRTPPRLIAPLLPLTPPPTDKKLSQDLNTVSSPSDLALSSVSINDQRNLVHGEHGPWDYFGPMVLFNSSRQPQLDDLGPKDHAEPSEIAVTKERKKQEPLFLPHDDAEEDEMDDVIFTHEVMQPPTLAGETLVKQTSCPSKRPRIENNQAATVDSSRQSNQLVQGSGTIRSLVGSQSQMQARCEEDSDDQGDEIEFVGLMTKKPRLEIANGNRPISNASSPVSGPLRALSPGDRSLCKACGCECNGQTRPLTHSGRSRGSGSQTLSNAVRGNIVELLVCPSQSLLNQLVHARSVNNWKDIAQIVGAKREDFDRVRHASKWLQDHLPDLVRRGAM